MKITAPTKISDTGPAETDAWCPGKIYLPKNDYVRGDYTNPFLYIKKPQPCLIRMSDGDQHFRTEARKEWVDVTSQFELLHAEYL